MRFGGRISPSLAGRRPVLLISRESAYGLLTKIIAAEITTTIRNIRIEVPLGLADGLPRPCGVNCDNLRTISREHLAEKIATLPSKRVREIKRAVGYALEWEELIEAE